MAVYDLGLSSEQFYALTPRQFHLLSEVHRRRLLHHEEIQAYTTAAVINYSLGAPEDAVQPMRFMPHWKTPQQVVATTGTAFTEDVILDWQTRVANLAAEMKQGHGPMLDEIRKQSNAG